MPKVYVVEKKEFDLSGAATFGQIEILFEKPRGIFFTSQKAFDIKDKLKDMQSSDYLVVGGNIILVLIAGLIIYEKFGFVNLLLFDVRSCEYTARVIARHHIQGDPHGR